ncbi:MAG: TIGR02099 family protein, partial [Shewanellaceae bacterium]|nr:TIGR02099 family protein [Shewanellaceae bacterium]
EFYAEGIRLNFQNLQIAPQINLPLTANMAEVELNFNWWSLLNRQNYGLERLVVRDVEMNLLVDQFSNQANVVKLKQIQDSLFNVFNRIDIESFTFYIRHQKQISQPIYMPSFHWQNIDDRHYGSGYLSHVSASGELEKIRVIANFETNNPEDTEPNGDIYLSANHFDLAQWYHRAGGQLDMIQGELNFEVHAQIFKGQLVDALMQMHPSQLLWQTKKNQQNFEIRRGTFFWNYQQDAWVLSHRNLAILSNGKPWPKLDIGLSYRAGQFNGYIDSLDIPTFLPLLVFNTNLGIDDLDAILDAKVEGKIKHIGMQTQPSSIMVQAQLQAFKSQPSAWIPGIDKLNLNYFMKDGVHGYRVPAQIFELDYQALSPRPLQVKSDNNWFFYMTSEDFYGWLMSDVNVEVDQIRARVSMAINEQSVVPTMSLYSELDFPDVKALPGLLPAQHLNPSLYRFLEQALQAGQLKQGQVLWHAGIDRFPITQSMGTFQAGFQLTDAKLPFREDWLPLTDLNLKVLFENNAAYFDLEQGKLGLVEIEDVNVNIQSLNDKPMLSVVGQINAPAEAITAVIKASPLQSTVGEALEQVQVSKPLVAELAVQVPLSAEDNRDVWAQGQLNFADNQLYLADLKLPLTEVHGQLTFTNSRLQSHDLKVNLYNQPTALKVETFAEDSEDIYNIRVDIDSQWNLNKLPVELANLLQGFYQGETRIKSKINLVLDEEGRNLDMNLSADFNQVALTLPAPLNKAKGLPLALEAKVVGNEASTFISARLGKKAQLNFNINHQQTKNRTHYDLMVGRLMQADDRLLQQDGHIHLDVDKLELSDWIDAVVLMQAESQAVQQQRARQKIPPATIIPTLKGVLGHVKQLYAWDNKIEDLKFILTPSTNNWLADIKAPSVDGLVTIHENWVADGLKFKGSRLAWKPQRSDLDVSDTQQMKILRALPKLQVEVDELSLWDKSLQQVVFQGQPSKMGYEANRMAFTYQKHHFDLSGDWQEKNNQHTTHMNFKINTKYVDNLFATLDPLNQKSSAAKPVSTGIKAENFGLTGRLTWADLPLNFEVDAVEGRCQLDIEQGKLMDQDTGGGRLISLFSVEGIFKKIALDFNDVFDDGFYFEQAKGTFTLNKSVLATQDLYFDGTAAGININGTTHLKTEVINYDVRVTPKIASVVPTAFFFTGLTAGVLAFMITKVLEPAIEVISEIRYKVTGTLNHRKIEEIAREQKTVEIDDEVFQNRERGGR